jgi:hypothetical protein
MKRSPQQILLVFTLLFVFCTAKAQNITGIWRGYFITEFSDQYKFELQIVQNNTNRVTGVSYSYLDTRFYGKATLTGYFTPSSDKALIQETKTVEVRMSAGSVACIMKCNFTYIRSGKEEFLEGEYTSTYEETSQVEGILKGGNCGGGKIYLRKVPTSDFYVEPFLRDNPTAKKPTTPAKQPPATKPPVTKSKTPTTKNPPAVVKKTPPAKTPAPKKTVPNTPVTKPKTTEVEKPKTDIAKNEAPKTIEVPKLTIPTQTRARNNELTKTLTVSNEEIIVRLYDNGEIDNDTISVYLDNKPVLTKQRLSAAPLIVTLKMDESNPDHVLIMVAENLGSIPPNTSLMVVQDGDKRHEVRITSTEQKNAMVRFRYLKK